MSPPFHTTQPINMSDSITKTPDTVAKTLYLDLVVSTSNFLRCVYGEDQVSVIHWSEHNTCVVSVFGEFSLELNDQRRFVMYPYKDVEHEEDDCVFASDSVKELLMKTSCYC